MASKYSSIYVYLTLGLTLTFAQLIHTSKAQGGQKEFTIFESRKNLPLADGIPVFRDYYVNMGVESGVKVGTILSVFRKVPVIDIYTNKAPGDLIVEVGQLKVIHTQKSMSVARIYSIANPKSIPVVQFEKAMLGDRVEISSTVQSAQDESSDDSN